MLNATRMWVSRPARHPFWQSLACGLAAGTAWVSVCAAYWTAFDPAPAARMAFAMAWVVALGLLAWPAVRERLSRIPHFWRVGMASCGMALWPIVWREVLARRSDIPLDWYSSETRSLLVMGIPAALVIVPAVFLGCMLLPVAQPSRGRDALDKNRFDSLFPFGWGVVLSSFLVPTTLFVRVGADQVLQGVAGVLLLGAGYSLFRGREGDSLSGEDTASGAQPPHDATGTSMKPLPLGLWGGMLAILVAVMLGVSIEGSIRTTEQLIIESLPLKFFGWGGFLAGVLLGAAWHRDTTDQRRGIRQALLWAACGAAAVLLLFPMWIRLGIWSSSRLSQMPQIILAKGAIQAGILAPLGLATGTLLARGSHRGGLVGLIGIGYAVGTAIVPPLAATQWGVACTSAVLGLTLVPREFWGQLTVRRGWNRQAFTLVAHASVIAAACVSHSWLNPARSAALLFNGEVFAAAGNGHDLETIEQSERSRLLSTVEGENGVWTVWRQRGNQLLARRNGVPASMARLDASLGPQNFWPVMTAAVPLILHPQAEDVLCLGMPGIVELDSLLTFPVKTLTCVGNDRSVRSIVEYQASLTDTTKRLTDGRLRWIDATPVQFATSGDSGAFDVILGPDASAVAMSRQAELTQEYHAQIARHLKEGGVFCQRMNIIDFGAGPVVDTLRSLSTTFTETLVITTDGTELLLIATNSSEPLLNAGVADRAEKPHVRQLCASLGADWSMMTQLACISPKNVEAILAEFGGRVNRSQNASFTMQLAAETLRWGPKWKEKQRLFANRAEIMLTLLELEDEQEQTIVRRIQDTQERLRILNENVDDQWSYRRSLREALKERPRTTIQRVNNEIRKTLVEDDKHRKEYLVALGRAARDAVPSSQAIEKLERFVTPYDPLVTDFAHFEMAQLLNRSATRDPVREYHHWMHCVSYAPDRDRSVRPVVAALQLLCESPEVVSDPAWRWDQYQALLDVMRTRWSMRWQAAVPSKFEAADLQHSIEAVTVSLDKMNDLRGEAGIDLAKWKVQRRVWQDTLVGPMRARQGGQEPRNQMLEAVRQEWHRRNADLNETSMPNGSPEHPPEAMNR